MIKYILGFILNILNKGVSIFVLIDTTSKVSPLSRIYPFAKIYNSEIDAYSYVGPQTEVVYAKIGKYCSIASHCTIGLGTHTLNYISTSPIFTEKRNGTKQKWIDNDIGLPKKEFITIGNDVWIGKKVILMSGISIGNGAIIGAGAIVTKDVPDYAIVAGIPAKVIKYRFDNSTIDTLRELKWWDLPITQIKNNISLFQSSEISILDLKNLSNNV